MGYSQSVLGGFDKNYSRSMQGGSEEYFSRSVQGGSDEYFSRSVQAGSEEYFSRFVQAGSKEYFSRSVQIGSDEYFSRSVQDGSDEYFSRSVQGGSKEYFSRSVQGGSKEYFSRTHLVGSDEVHEIHCEPCKKDGTTVDAVKHCLDCSEYLCAQCFKSHTRFKAFQDHVTNDVGSHVTNDVGNHVTNDVSNVNPPTIKNNDETIGKSVEPLSKLHIDHKNEQQSSKQSNVKSSKKPHRKVKAELVSRIDVGTSQDKQKASIHDLTIVHTYYCVVTDNNNMSVKVVDTRRNCVISEVQISEAKALYHITSVNDDQVVVTAEIKGVGKLLFLSVSTSGIISKTDKSFDMKYIYRCIIHHNHHFYAVDLSSIYKISMSGQVIKRIIIDSVSSCEGMCFSNDHNTIYVCSNDQDTVLRVDLEGNIKATYKDQDLKALRGVTVDSEGYVYVCSMGSDCVLQLTADLDKVQVIISGFSVVRCTFNRTDNRLYVKRNNKILVYDIKYE